MQKTSWNWKLNFFQRNLDRKKASKNIFLWSVSFWKKITWALNKLHHWKVLDCSSVQMPWIFLFGVFFGFQNAKNSVKVKNVFFQRNPDRKEALKNIFLWLVSFWKILKHAQQNFTQTFPRASHLSKSPSFFHIDFSQRDIEICTILCEKWRVLLGGRAAIGKNLL